MKRKNISGYEIFKYWSGKEDYKGIMWVIDPGEKMCFKCGHLDSEISNGESLKTFWNKSTGLEKAHIVPHSLGGSDEPSNIIFLCSDCHKESPDTIDYELNLKWISDHRKDRVLTFLEPIISELTNFQIEQISKISPFDIKNQVLKKIGLHGNSISDSSLQLGLLQVIQDISKVGVSNGK